MRCASCGFENPEGVKFCEECGTKFVPLCLNCGHELRPSAKFCGECGTPTEGEKGKRRNGEKDKDAKLRTLNSEPPSAERRQLTVMFCDLVGSTSLSEQLDPEEYREVVRAYQETCEAVIQRYDGRLAQYLGDGILVYFGYPAAHEDDAQRAVRTGLEILAGLQSLNAQLPPALQARLPHPVQVRLGVHTGPVVVGEIGGGERREMLALGETPNVAARLQGLADPNTLVISASTQRLLLGLFNCQDLGRQELKGISAPLQVYRVLSESRAQSRLEVDVSTGKLTPLVGRANEVGLILERWAAAQAGDGQVVLVSGEPGIGKSRLVQEVRERLVQQQALCLEFRCSPYSQNSAFAPVLAHLQRLLEFERNDLPQDKLAKLQQTLTRYHFPQADTLSLLAGLLSLPHPENAPALTLSPQKQKQKTQEALVAWLVEEAERHPVYCVWEDLHWADPSTLELLGLLLDQVPTVRMLVLLTARPEFIPPWSSRTHLIPLSLTRLPRTQAGEMIEKVTGGKPLPAEVQQQIVSKTDGVPLFVEELTKMVVESGIVREEDGAYTLTGPLPPLAIPTTLHDSLMARLDRLATAREVAQMGATLGREFPYELLQAVSPVEEATLQQALTKLVEAEVLYQRGLPPQARYIFKHALIQDAAYQSLLKSRRQQYHKQIARVLEERFTETKETQPELLAHHYTEAGLIEQAIPYWHRAGQRAVERSANLEALNHLTKGVGLLKTLPDTPERIQQELTLQITLSDVLITVKGETAPDVEKTVLRARELCQQLGETPQIFPVLWRLVIFYINRADLQTTYHLAKQMMPLAQSVQDPEFLWIAHFALGAPSLWRGELVSARRHLEQAIALSDGPQTRLRLTIGTADSRVNCLFYTAWTLWYLGYPDQALKRSEEAVALAESLSHPYTLAVALGFAALFHLFRRDEQLARERAEAVISLSTEQGFSLYLVYGMTIRGWALSEQGQVAEGVAQMRQSGGALLCPYELAEAYGKVGQIEEGLTVLTETQASVDRTGWRVKEAELYRLRGELTLAQSSVQSLASSVQKEAEEYFHKAIEIARRQQAKSLELRAKMSLARLWQRQASEQSAKGQEQRVGNTEHETRAKLDEAHRMLSEVYNWFTEGFDTKDLQEAKTLLEELA